MTKIDKGIPLSKGYLVVDPKKCTGCCSCMLACSLVHEGKSALSLARIQILDDAFGSFPTDIKIVMCQQCDNPECYLACPLEDGFDLVIPRLANTVEPLHAIYTKDCLAPMEHMLNQGRLSVVQLFPLVRAGYVEAEEIDIFDPKHLSFYNVNTKADLKKARELVKKKEKIILTL